MKDNNFSKVQKKIFFVVIAIHLCFIFIFSMNKKDPFFDMKKKQVIVNEKILIQPSFKEEKKKSVIRKKSKHIVKKTEPYKNKKKDYLLKKLEESIAQTDTLKSNKNNDIIIPTKISKLNIDSKVEIFTKDEKPQYHQLLIDEMQNNLHLPEYGEVKMEVVISSQGEVKSLKAIDVKSNKNQIYLEKAINNMTFPWIEQFFSEKKDISFTITFRNAQ